MASAIVCHQQVTISMENGHTYVLTHYRESDGKMVYLTNLEKDAFLKSILQCNVSTMCLELDHTVESMNLTKNTYNDCTYLNYRDKCSDPINLIRCGVENLITKFNEDIDCSREIFKLKDMHDKLFAAYINVKHDARRFVMQESLRKILKLEESLENLSHAFRNAIYQLKRKTIEDCALQIDRGNVESAAEKYQSLGLYATSETLNEFIDELYRSYEKSEALKIIIKFIESLSLHSRREMGYKYLLEIIESRSVDFDIIAEILMLDEKIQKLSNEVKTHERLTYGNALWMSKNKIPLLLNRIFKRWTQQIEKFPIS